MRKKCGNWILRFRGEGSNPLPGVFQNPSPSVPPAPRYSPPLPGSDVTAGRVGRGGVGLRLGLRGRKRRGSGTRGGGSGRCSETGDAGVPVPCALSPEAVRGCTGASCGEGADFASGLEGCVSGRPGRRGAWGPGRVRGVRPQGSDPGGTPRACARGYAAPANQSPLAGFGSRTGLLPAQPAWQPAPTAFPSSGCRLVSGVASLLSQSASALQQPRWHREPPPCPLCTWEEVGLATACPEGRKELGVQRTEVANIKPLINLI